MEYIVYGKINEEQVITFVGCAKSTEQVPLAAIVLQKVSEQPELHWVKWSVRFRRTLKDTKALDNPLADRFTNSARLKRLLDSDEAQHILADRNAQFLDFHMRNLRVMAEVTADARHEKESGRTVYSASEHMGKVRWGEKETDHDDEPFKIDSVWTAWYARAMQMEDPYLVGFFRLRDSLADGLTWTDGRTWAQFAAEHRELLKWSEPYEDLAHRSWEYHE